jgi:hypothetical protein
VGALEVILGVGPRVERQLAEFGSALPAPTQAALDGRVGVSIAVLVALALALIVHRHRRAVVFLVLLGLLQLSIAGLYGLALWLPYRPHRHDRSFP